jgi:hypothetical protein
MTWNFDQYYTNSKDGLMAKLLLSEQEKEKLKALRLKVRTRIKEVFEEAKQITMEVKQHSLMLESIQTKLAHSKLKYLSSDEQLKFSQLILGMEEEARTEFSSLTPRFWTQGSFMYNTLNRPFGSEQEMDIDDGTYLPMTIFESEPKIGHSLLLLLVDSSLKSLEAENTDWVFEAKDTCGRIKILSEKTHIDVPMYAIPKEQFLKKQLALEGFKERAFFESVNNSAMDKSINDRAFYELESELVNLALRTGDKKWLNSDPKIVEDWFNSSCSRIGHHVRKVCRFIKAWRDAQWDVGGGASSISLMVAIVKILDEVAHDSNDISATMKIVAEYLPMEFARGVESPDDTAENLLFPCLSEHSKRENDIMEKLNLLPTILRNAEVAGSKESALELMNQAFGNRLIDIDLIVSKQAAPAFAKESAIARSPAIISTTMVSG